ncbi:DoxX family protein [Anditalea andensis]|uniref:DoxX-like family protein n=1 Tax=Anditalea andensis TaxID=1048983 RepID=A0A074L774_9BACT|nr:DoxX family protein [Anditalea andensis]KEO75683.1 hypothetical protein EL17_21880 [Anditalea andensis]
MKKKGKIIYWVSTIWLCLGMASTGIVQVVHLDEEMVKMNMLGYPSYFVSIIGIWKLLGTVAVLVPGFPRLKEWAYAGFFLLMSGAVFSHLAVGDEAYEFFGPALILLLIFVSWYFRPLTRKLASPDDEN